MSEAVYPGSFDPFTNGHLDVLDRALKVFDRVIVAVLANPAKEPLLTTEERVQVIRAVLQDRERVEVDSFQGLTVDYARRRGAGTLVRGLRAYSDFDAELQLALMNRKLAPDVQTIFLMSSFAHIFVASSTIKEIAGHGRDVSDFVPPAVAEKLKEKFQ
ncbi:MAG: pantetheine-phosphate adenylyltransferase [Candidatus Dormibacteraceae bacterium]